VTPALVPKRASGCMRSVVGADRRRSLRSCRSTALLRHRIRSRAVGARVARYYDPSTAQFATRDPLEAQTGAPYSYAGGDPLDASDPSGLDWCVGSVCLGFHPSDAIKPIVNIGRGASFGLSDNIANWISPGASCTVDQNALDQFLGGAASTAVFGELRAIRGAYVGATRAIPFIAESPEDAYALRNGLKVAARELTPRPFRYLAQLRRGASYADMLAEKGAAGVIASASRTNPWVNFFFGLE
jgi:uncharacterized protein RhaS with RHS repeats